MSDNAKFRAQQEGKVSTELCTDILPSIDILQGHIFATDLPYFDWVRTIASDHVSTPLNFAWVCCWASGTLNGGGETFAAPTEKYLTAVLSRQLATTNRMFNDLSSIARDTTECNLNSVHFPEFNKTRTPDVAV